MSCFVGFGFGPIQSGLFLSEAFRSGKFDRLVVAEVNPALVDQIRANGGQYCVNIAQAEAVEVERIEGVEILNPAVDEDRAALIQAIAQASEAATALPSVDLFDAGQHSVASILAQGFALKLQDPSLPACVVYTGENNNHAAEVLAEKLRAHLGVQGEAGATAIGGRVQTLNTVIGKMSGVVVGAQSIAEQKLEPMTAGAERAFLVEAFNRILISRIELPGFTRSIAAFEEKNDLMPFEEAKLYGHNATHALLGYLARRRGCEEMSQAASHADLMQLAREAFLEESGKALIHKYDGLDPLFTPAGYLAYAEDLLVRMVNPFLRDATDRVVRDPSRKLSWNDRLVGTMRLALAAGLEPRRFAAGARCALDLLAEEKSVTPAEALKGLWPEVPADDPVRAQVEALINQAQI